MATEDPGSPSAPAVQPDEAAVRSFVHSIVSVLPFDQLDERVTALERAEGQVSEKQRAMEGRISELETRVGDVAGDEHDDVDLTERIDALDDRLQTLEGLFSDAALDRHDAHADAQERDPSDVAPLGADRELVVQEVQLDQARPQLVGRIDSLVVFVSVDDRSLEVSEGDLVRVTITSHGQRCAHASLNDPAV